jgi:hypothetical protein
VVGLLRVQLSEPGLQVLLECLGVAHLCEQEVIDDGTSRRSLCRA